MTYSLNTTYFSNIKTEAQAYCLGYFYARASGHIQLRREDEPILHTISSLLNYNGPVRVYDKIAEINICQSEFTNNLLAIGCKLNNKYMSSLPCLELLYLRSFIRSIFDNYGRMYLTKNKYLNVNITFNEQFISELRLFLKQKLNIETKHYYRYTYSNNLQMMITKKTSAINFLNYIYSPSLYYLERKYNKYQEYTKKGV